MANRIKVLFVGAFLSPSATKVRGGVQFECQSLIESPVSQHIEWMLLDTTMESIPAPPLRRRFMLAARRFVIFTCKVLFRRPDCCLIYVSSGASFIEKGTMTLLARALGIRVVLRPVSGLIIDDYRRSIFFRWHIRLAVRATSLLACQGARWREFFQSVGSLTAEQTPVIYNPVDASTYARIPVSGGGDGRRVLMIGWVERNKGIWDLLEVAKRFSRELEGLTFVICGHGAEYGAFESAIREAGIGRFFELRGWVTWEEKLEELAKCEIYLMLSHREGLPNALLEAMAAGRAVVATAVGAIPDVVVEGVTGCLCESGDVDDIGFRILELHRSSLKRAELGSAARRLVERQFDYEVTWRKWREILVGDSSEK